MLRRVSHNLCVRGMALTLAESGIENLAVRHTMLDLMTYADDRYKRELFDALRQSLGRIAQEGGSGLPLCVVAHGFGSILAVDFFKELQRLGADELAEVERPATPLERGETLAFFCTLGSPSPLMIAQDSTPPLNVPSPLVLQRLKTAFLLGGSSC